MFVLRWIMRGENSRLAYNDDRKCESWGRNVSEADYHINRVRVPTDNRCRRWAQCCRGNARHRHASTPHLPIWTFSCEEGNFLMNLSFLKGHETYFGHPLQSQIHNQLGSTSSSTHFAGSIAGIIWIVCDGAPFDEFAGTVGDWHAEFVALVLVLPFSMPLIPKCVESDEFSCLWCTSPLTWICSDPEWSFVVSVAFSSITTGPCPGTDCCFTITVFVWTCICGGPGTWCCGCCVAVPDGVPIPCFCITIWCVFGVPGMTDVCVTWTCGGAGCCWAGAWVWMTICWPRCAWSPWGVWTILTSCWVPPGDCCRTNWPDC